MKINLEEFLKQKSVVFIDNKEDSKILLDALEDKSIYQRASDIYKEYYLYFEGPDSYKESFPKITYSSKDFFDKYVATRLKEYKLFNINTLIIKEPESLFDLKPYQ